MNEFVYLLKIKGENVSDIKAIKKACDREGLKFNKMIVSALIFYFTQGKWSELIKIEGKDGFKRE
jgi:hypothetical protein